MIGWLKRLLTKPRPVPPARQLVARRSTRGRLVIFSGPRPKSVEDEVTGVALAEVELVDGSGSGFVTQSGIATFARIYDVNAKPVAEMPVRERAWEEQNVLRMPTSLSVTAEVTIKMTFDAALEARLLEAYS